MKPKKENSMRSFKLMSATVLMIFFTASMGYASTFNDIDGWNDTSVFFDGVKGHEGSVSGIDIDGEVGHPVYVGSPRANCKPSGNWSLNVEVSDGTLPPGLSLSTVSGEYGVIKGIPTSRGHWIVEMRAYDLKCEGKYYMGFTQQLRFHISGSGRVIQ